MLKCKELTEQGSDYLSHGLPLSKRLSVAFHLLICGKCRDFIKYLKISIAYFNALPEQEIDNDSANRIARKAMNQKDS